MPSKTISHSFCFILSGLITLAGLSANAFGLEREKVSFGKTRSGKNLFAIRVYKKDHKLPMRPAVLVTGGIHGNEHMGLVRELAETVSEGEKGFKEFFAAGGIAYFFPEVNPDGVASGNRYNPFGFDLNRDFRIGRKPSQDESAQMLEFLEKDLDKFHARPILAMDYHCCSKSLIYPKVEKTGFYNNHFEKIVKLMQAHVDPTYTSGLTKDIFGYETHGTLKGYWFKKYGALSFTYEGADPKEEAKKVQGHLNWWKEIMAVVVDVYDNKLASLRPMGVDPKASVEEPKAYTE